MSKDHSLEMKEPGKKPPPAASLRPRAGSRVKKDSKFPYKSPEAWRKVLPKTVPDSMLKEIKKYSSHPGATFSGAGGGYVIVVSEKKIEGAFKIKIRY